MAKTSAVNCKPVCFAALCLAFAAFAGLPAYAAPAYAAPAYPSTVTTHPKLAAFSAIRLSGLFRLDFTRSKQQTISLSGDSTSIEALRVSVADGVLSIVGPSGDASQNRLTQDRLAQDKTITVTIAAPTLDRADFNGLVRASITGLNGPDFSLDNNGSAAATISGKVRHVQIKTRGIASIDARALHARNLAVMVRGQGNLRVFASHSAKIYLYGEGRIEVFGHPPARQFNALAYGVITMR